MASKNPLDSNNYKALLGVGSWHNGSGSVTFSFLTSIPTYYKDGKKPDTKIVGGEVLSTNFDVTLNAAEQALANLAVQRFNDVCNIRLVEAAPGAIGDVTFAKGDFPGLFGFVADFPQNTFTNGSGDNGDVWISNIPQQEAADLYNTGWQTYLHELGHALGLKHPFDGSPLLYSGLDTNQYTVMSYDPHPDQAGEPEMVAQWPATLMMFDIQAMQSLYGANMTTRTGDDTYFGPGPSQQFALEDGGKLIMTIWDAGGVDEINASNQTSKVTIDLRPGYFSSIGAIANNICIAYGGKVPGAMSAWIENASGGSADDILIGNEINNLLSGGGGNDTLNLTYGGNDDALGGEGNDLFIVGGALTKTDRLDGGAGTDRVLMDGNYSGGLKFTGSTLVNIERIDLTAGNSYQITSSDGTVSAGLLFTVDGSTLGADDILTFKGNRETDARFVLKGGAGDDDLTGGRGSDTLSGGDGDDILNGGRGSDQITLGGGDDRIVYLAVVESAQGGRDRILDMTADDILDLSAIDANTGLGGNQAFFQAAGLSGTAGQFTLVYDNSADESLLSADVNGDGVADLLITLNGDVTGFVAGWVL
jgi:serralysin